MTGRLTGFTEIHNNTKQSVQGGTIVSDMPNNQLNPRISKGDNTRPLRTLGESPRDLDRGPGGTSSAVGLRSRRPSPTPIRRRHVPENRDRGGCTPSPAWRLLARSTRGPAARSRPGGAGRYLHWRARRPTTRSKPWGMRWRRVQGSCGQRVHPSPQADIIQRGCQTERSGGGRKACWLWHVLPSAS